MAIAVDNAGASSTSRGASTCTIASFAVGAGSNRLLVVGITATNTAGTGNPAISTVTFNGTGLTRLGGVALNGQISDIWYLKAPANVTANIVATLSTSALNTDMIVGATSWTGVDQTTTWRAISTATGVTDTSSISPTSAVSDVVHDTVNAFGPSTMSAGTGQTEAWNTTIALDVLIGGGSTIAGAASSTTMTWTFSPTGVTAWTQAGAAMIPASGGASTPVVIDETFQHAYFLKNATLQEYHKEWPEFVPKPPTAGPLYPETENLFHAPTRPEYLYKDEGPDSRNVFPIVIPVFAPMQEEHVQAANLPADVTEYDDEPWFGFVPPPPVTFDPQRLPQEESLQFVQTYRVVDDLSGDVALIFLPPFDAVDEIPQTRLPRQDDEPWQSFLPTAPSVFDDEFTRSWRDRVVEEEDEPWQSYVPPAPAAFDDDFVRSWVDRTVSQEDELHNFLPPAPTAFDDDFIARYADKLLTEDDEPWFAFVPPAPTGFDPQFQPYDEPDSYSSHSPLVVDTSDDAPLQIILPPFVDDLQVDPKLMVDYVTRTIEVDDWLQPPQAPINNVPDPGGRSTRLGLLFPAHR